MKKILVLLTLLFVLTACGNAPVVTEELPVSTAEQFIIDIYATLDAQETQRQYQEDQNATLMSWLTTMEFEPTWTPYPTPIPSTTPTATLAYYCDGVRIRTTEKARLWTPRWNSSKTALKKLNGKLIVLLVPLKAHTGINPGVELCAFDRVQTDKGTMWAFWYYRPLGYLGDTYGYYISASQVERITK